MICNGSLQLHGQSYFGIRAGFGASYIRAGYAEIYHKFGFSDPLLNYYLAGFYSKNLNNKLNANIELQFSRKGYAYNIDNYFDLKSITAQRTIFATSVNFFTVYQLLNKTSKKKSMSFGVITGIYSSALLNNQWTYGNADPVNVDHAMKPFDFGFMTGIRLEKRQIKKKNNLSMDIRYYQGLIDISESYEQTTFRTFEIGLGYWFLFKHKNK